MKNDKCQIVFRKLIYFFENKIPVHFKDTENIFYNGLIIDLSEKNYTLVIKERMRGEIPILLEVINPDSISKFIEGENEYPS